ncbi:MAG: ABC transporter permease [Paludibacteraceae bacterium]|nr:ABC transporter permease [Paludibacteraceae bacterium]
MKFPFYIALRYLFSPKKHSAINIISLICAIGIGIGALALVCVLSVYNGFQDLIGGTFSQFDPDLRISRVEGKSFDIKDDQILRVKALPCVEQAACVLEENAVVKCGDRQTWLTIKGVSDNYKRLIDFGNLLKDGRFVLSNGDTPFGILGLTLAVKLNASLYVPNPLEVYAPKHAAAIDPSNPSNAFNQKNIFLSGIYSVEQEEVDGRYLIVSLKEAQQLFGYKENEGTALELKLKPGENLKRTKQAIAELLGPKYKIEDRREQHQDFYRMLKVEKWISFLILTFILLIAVFNVTGSLSMLIIEKKNDINTLRNLGADKRTISRIFLLEGWLVTAIGAAIGTLAGVLLCAAQQQWGLLRLGSEEDNGIFLTDAYPVVVQATDIFAVLATVLFAGLLVAWLPSRHLASGK